MLISVNPHSGVPVYRQLMDQIKFHIASGLMKPGDELPSTRMLSSELGVNPMTISKAYSFLEKEGIVERRPGRPLIEGRPGQREAAIPLGDLGIAGVHPDELAELERPDADHLQLVAQRHAGDAGRGHVRPDARCARGGDVRRIGIPVIRHGGRKRAR